MSARTYKLALIGIWLLACVGLAATTGEEHAGLAFIVAVLVMVFG
jgi:uncharacterized membrane protein YhiD involved in acid resistance